jgi:hypothetical protein
MEHGWSAAALLQADRASLVVAPSAMALHLTSCSVLAPSLDDCVGGGGDASVTEGGTGPRAACRSLKTFPLHLDERTQVNV